MASKVPLEATPLKTLQRYHHASLNQFGDGETLVDAVQRRPGFYGPNPIAYLSLMARRSSLTLGDLEEALINDRSLIRASTFRSSVFLTATEDFPIYFRAFADGLASSGMARLRSSGIDENTLALYARRLKEAGFTMSKSPPELLDIMLPAREKRPDPDVERVLFRKLCDLGVLVRTTSKGWKGNQYNYALVDRWLDGVALTAEHPEAARLEVVRRYLRAYGPARLEDISWWTGLSPVDVRRFIDQLGREVLNFPVDGLGEGLIALRETLDAIRKSALEPGRILFLPLWDAFPLGWRDRTRVVDPAFAPWVYDPAGNSASVIVEDGRVIGLWQFRDGDSITLEFHVLEPYANRLNALRLAADDHAAALASVAGARDVRVIERALPPPLAERPAASFLWPLGKEPVFRVSDTLTISNPMDRRGPNVLRSKFLDDERLIRPSEEVSSPGRPSPSGESGEGASVERAARAERRERADGGDKADRAEKAAKAETPEAEPAKKSAPVKKAAKTVKKPSAAQKPKPAVKSAPKKSKPAPAKKAAVPAKKSSSKPSSSKKAPAKAPPKKSAGKKAPAKKAAKKR